MGAKFKADGDTWEVAIEAHAPRPAVSTLVFHCVSNPQRPYRVLPVPVEEGGEGRPYEDLPADRLRELFSRSQIMDYALDSDADPRRIERRTEP